MCWMTVWHGIYTLMNGTFGQRYQCGIRSCNSSRLNNHVTWWTLNIPLKRTITQLLALANVICGHQLIIANDLGRWWANHDNLPALFFLVVLQNHLKSPTAGERHVICFVEKVGFESITLGYLVLLSANCARSPVALHGWQRAYQNGHSIFQEKIQKKIL